MTATLEEIEQEELKLEQDISDLKAQAAPETAEDDAAGGGGEPGAPPPEEAALETADKAETIPEIFAADYALLKSEVHSLAKKIYGEAVTLEEAGKTFLLKLGDEVKHIFCF